MARLLALLVLLLAVAGVVWFSWSGDDLTDAAPPGQVTAGPGDAAVAGTAVDATPPAAAGTEPIAVERDAVAIESEATTGSLLFTVVWANDKSPARGVAVAVYRSGADSLFEQPRGVTDERGQFVFERLAPGQVTPICLHGEQKWGEKIEIRAGQRVAATLELPLGLCIKGRVVDGANAPVAGADIAVTDWGGGTVEIAGQSGTDGTFSVRGLANSCHVGARKAGYCPTSMRTLTTSDGAEVEFTIVMDKIGGSLRGTVLGPEGLPVGNAAVRVGTTEQNNHKLPDGGSAMGWQPQLVRSDAQGRFELASVVPGKIPVAVRGQGLAPWSEEVEIAAGRPTEITVHLLRGASLFGIAKNAAGEPLAKVTVRVGDWQTLGNRSVRTATDGSYRIDGLGIGTSKATARHEDHGQVDESFDFVAGDQRQWDPVLTAGLQLRGRVIDNDGKPVARAMIEAMLDPWVPGINWFGHANTDADGRFALKNCRPDRTLKLTVRRKSIFPEATRTKLMPGPEEIEIRLSAEAWVYIEGTVLGPDDEVLANVSASPYLVAGGSGSPVETVDPATGKFRFGPYPPSEYRITFSVDGFPAIQLEHTFAANETWNVGTLRFERGGFLKVQLVPDTAAADPGKHSFRIHGEGKRGAQIETENGSGRCGPLAPGDYELLVTGGVLASHSVPFTIRAERDTVLDVPITVGNKAAIAIALPADAEPSGWVELIARDASGRIAHRRSVYHNAGAYNDSVALSPGRYSLTATWKGHTAEGTLDVATDAVSTTLQLR